MRKVTDEIRSAFENEDDINLTALNALPYLMACLNEALRRFPPVPPGLPRVTPKGGAIIDGHVVAENVSAKHGDYPFRTRDLRKI